MLRGDMLLVLLKVIIVFFIAPVSPKGGIGLNTTKI